MKKNKRMELKLTRPLTHEEAATVLAALRVFQRQSPETIARMEHFEDGETPLTDEQIDGLCEAINFDEAGIPAKPPQPAPPNTRHYCIEWNWQDGDDNRFYTEADITEPEAQTLAHDLTERADNTDDISTPVVCQYTPVHQDFDSVRREIVDALGDDTCPTCFTDLSGGQCDCPKP